MTAWSEVEKTQCPIARVQNLVSERWTVLILWEMFLGSARFDDIQVQTGATPQMLAARLKKLEKVGLVQRRPYNMRPLRHEYVLTEMGLDFYPAVMALRAWGERWCKPRNMGLAVQYVHLPCGDDPGLGSTCQTCGMGLKPSELAATFAPAYALERQGKLQNAKRA